MLCAAEPATLHCKTVRTFRCLVYQLRWNSPADEKDAGENRDDAKPLQSTHALTQKDRGKKNRNGSVERGEHGNHRNLFDLHAQITQDERAGIEKAGPGRFSSCFYIWKSKRQPLCFENRERRERGNSPHQPNGRVRPSCRNGASAEQPKHYPEKDSSNRSPH